MSPLAEFLEGLLREGQAVLRDRPPPEPPAADVRALLERTYAAYRLRVAGPPPEFDVEAALAAAVLVHQATWFLVSRDKPVAELERLVVLPGSPRTPAAHLSADMTLRFLPQIHRRARAHDPADRLTTLLADILRRWPLSGVLADVDEEPLTPPDFAGHRGLCLLYAERLAQHEKSAWVPRDLGLEYVHLVYAELGRDPAALLGHPGKATDD
jgi:hypothetical protein